MGLPCKLQKPPDTGPSYYYHYRSSCCPPFKLPYPVNLILLLMLAPLILLSLLKALKVPWLPLDWIDLNLMSCAVNAAILTAELSNVRLFHRTNICSPPFRMLYQMKLVQLLLLTLLLMLRLVILLKVPWLPQEWMDPRLLECAVDILTVASWSVSILLFLYEHIPRQLFKMGSATDHLLFVEFLNGAQFELYFHVKDCNTLQSIKTRAIVYFGFCDKVKRNILYLRSTSLYFKFIFSSDSQYRTNRETIISSLVWVTKLLLLVINLL